MTFPKGASLDDPSGLFNADLKGNAWLRVVTLSVERDNATGKALKREPAQS